MNSTASCRIYSKKAIDAKSPGCMANAAAAAFDDGLTEAQRFERDYLVAAIDSDLSGWKRRSGRTAILTFTTARSIPAFI